jgi:4'-phosphopantetheinyl transferase
MRLKTLIEIERWRPVTGPPSLPPAGLHLWRIRTGEEGASLSDLWTILSPREVEHANRLRFSLHRERYVRAHAGLRIILSKYINLHPRDIVFKYGIAGKPLLHKGALGVDFNMTTSDDLALVAVSGGESVGVDCELVRERVDIIGIAKRMFSAEETSRIATAPPEDRLERFHVAWTALEARVKADGSGLFRRTEPKARRALEIAHCVPEYGFIAAVARRRMPPMDEWMALELASG